MIPGVFAKTFPGTDPTTVLTACRTAGFTTAQYNMACSGLNSLPASISEQIADKVKAASDATRVQIVAISATYNMTDPDRARRDAGRLAFTAIAGVARRIGTNLITVCSGSKDPDDQWRFHPANQDRDSWLEMCREFEAILEIAERHDLMIGVEPEQANIVSSSRKAARLLEEMAGSRLRIVLDPANILEGVSAAQQYPILDEAFELLGPAIGLCHAKDRHPDGRVAPAGLGVVDWAYVLRGLSAVGFDGAMVAHGISPDEAAPVAGFLDDLIGRT